MISTPYQCRGLVFIAPLEFVRHSRSRRNEHIDIFIRLEISKDEIISVIEEKIISMLIIPKKANILL